MASACGNQVGRYVRRPVPSSAPKTKKFRIGLPKNRVSGIIPFRCHGAVWTRPIRWATAKRMNALSTPVRTPRGSQDKSPDNPNATKSVNQPPIATPSRNPVTARPLTRTPASRCDDSTAAAFVFQTAPETELPATKPPKK